MRDPSRHIERSTVAPPLLSRPLPPHSHRPLMSVSVATLLIAHQRGAQSANRRMGALGTWARVNEPPRRNVRGARRGSGARNGSPDRRLSDPGDGDHDLQKERRACGQAAVASRLNGRRTSERSSARCLRADGWAVGFSLAGLPYERRAVSSGRADRRFLTSWRGRTSFERPTAANQTGAVDRRAPRLQPRHGTSMLSAWRRDSEAPAAPGSAQRPKSRIGRCHSAGRL